jgi:hypothetical protein
VDPISTGDAINETKEMDQVVLEIAQILPVAVTSNSGISINIESKL